MLVFILLVASFDLLLGYTGIVSFAHTMFFGIGAYGVAIASLRLGEGFGAVLIGHGRGARRVARAVDRDRPLLAAREGDLLRDDHARGGLGLPDPGLAAVRLHRRRGRPHLQEPGRAEPGVRALRRPRPRPRHRRQGGDLLPAVRRRRCCSSWRCCASSTRRSAACCRRSARTTSAPRRSAIAPWSTGPGATSSRPRSPRWPAPCSRCGCATWAPTPRCRSRSCSTSC